MPGNVGMSGSWNRGTTRERVQLRRFHRQGPRGRLGDPLGPLIMVRSPKAGEARESGENSDESSPLVARSLGGRGTAVRMSEGREDYVADNGPVRYIAEHQRPKTPSYAWEETGPMYRRVRWRPKRFRMAAYVALAGVVLLLAWVAWPTRSPTPPSTSDQRAVWVWQTTAALRDAAPLLDLCLHHRINAVYLAFNPVVPWRQYATFVAASERVGCRIWAAGGNDRWLTRHGRRAMAGWIASVIHYNAGVRPHSQFVGVVLDIEPWSSSKWKRSRERLLRDYMATIGAASGGAHRGSLPLVVTVPFWWNTTPVPGRGQDMGEWTIRHTSDVVILAYRARAVGPRSVVSAAAPLLKESADLGRHALVGVTTRPGPLSLGTTFGDVASSLKVIGQKMEERPAYLGWVVNDYETWSALPGSPSS